jgi:hypothetical protein
MGSRAGDPPELRKPAPRTWDTVAEAQGPAAGLEIVDRLPLEDYRYLHATRGEPSGACSIGDWQNSAGLPVPLGNDGFGPGAVVTAHWNNEVVRTWAGFRRRGHPVRRSPRRR